MPGQKLAAPVRRCARSVVQIVIVGGLLLALPETALIGQDTELAGSGDTVRHPISDNRVLPPDVTIRNISVESEEQGSIDGLPTTFDESSALAVLGSQIGPPSQSFGRVEDVVVDSDGRVFLLDSRLMRVHGYSSGLEHLTTFGQGGPGAGRFIAPRAIAVGPDQGIWVADYDGTIEVFKPVADGNGYNHVETHTFGIDIYDLCFIGEHLFLNGMRESDNKTLFRVGDDGHIDRAFGHIYETENLLVSIKLAGGKLLCVSSRDMLVFAPSNVLGEVRAYEHDGRLLWVTMIGDYRPIQLYERPTGGTSVRIPDTGFHRTEALGVLPESHVLMQIAEVTRGSRDAGDPYDRLLTVVLDLASGEGEMAGTHFPRFGGIYESRSVWVEPRQYPKVSVFLQEH